MCSGVDYGWQGRRIRAYVCNPRAMPVLLRSGDVRLLPWGRHEGQIGCLPPGGWARQEAIRRGVWARWNPRPALLDVYRWMEYDYEGNIHWYELRPCEFIQGLVARSSEEQRVYVVTTVPIYGAADTCWLVFQLVLGGNTATSAKRLMLRCIEITAIFLLATVLYVIAVGLYELFFDDRVPLWSLPILTTSSTS